MRIAIVTDAWHPQVNGVVRTLSAVRDQLLARGHRPLIIGPDQFPSIPCPTYPEIRLALTRESQVARRIEAAAPDAVHIATEGPLGLAARAWCLRRGYSFTTAYHTEFPDYLAKRTRLPASWFWRYIRWFHTPARAILVSTAALRSRLAFCGLPHGRVWGRGVDLACFNPAVPSRPDFSRVPRPVLLYVGRIAVEKNVGAFLECRHPGTKILVGDGPAAGRLKRSHPEAAFLGVLQGHALASAYAAADVLVFPSRTDTFGLVMIEALACGTPVAAYPVPGPSDVLQPGIGCMDDDLDAAISGALACRREDCAYYGSRFSWTRSAGQFLSALVPLEGARRSSGRTSRTAA